MISKRTLEKLSSFMLFLQVKNSFIHDLIIFISLYQNFYILMLSNYKLSFLFSIALFNSVLYVLVMNNNFEFRFQGLSHLLFQ